VCIVIPARLNSTRLSQKVLQDINGKPMLWWVYEKAKKVKGVDTIIIATDNKQVEKVANDFGAKVIMTSNEIQSGTDRVASVAKKLILEKGENLSPKIYINLQGDEPEIDPSAIEKALELVTSNRFDMATVAAPLSSKDFLENPNVVKVLVDQNQRAIYFSRFPIPYTRVLSTEFKNFIPKHHLGLYVYRTETLLKFSSLPRTDLEIAESLEQLRALYYGIPIGVAITERASLGVDTQEDLERVRRNLLS
jgi:3-deoxy-manno-octulosonate cytidylyltransferase (CMP-KDO synthetase)